jgi:hypothetical protein
MKYLCFTVVCLFCFANLSAQSNLVLFTEGGENFILYANGVRQNAQPQPNVKAVDVTGDFVQLKVEFDTAIPAVSQGTMVEPNMEMTFMIKKNNKGKYVLRPVSSTPLTATTTVTETVVVKEAAPEESARTVNNSQEMVTTTVTTTNKATPADNATVGINVSDGQSNVSMNVNVNIATQESLNMNSTVTTTNTTTTNTSSHAYDKPNRQYTKEEKPVAVSEGCSTAMTPSEFESAKKSINNKSVADDKITLSKQILKANCVSVKQVLGFMQLFSFEENKLEFAKMAYPKTVDKGNYYQINDGFTYSTSIDELNTFLEQQ